jgi:NodT family efflux transporter outer membrane factor (OMF) lipoprotein
VTRYPTTPLPGETVSADVPGVQAQRLVAGRDIPAEWWTLFECPALDSLVRQALADSPTLVQAKARLVQAQEDLSAREGATKLPRVDASASANQVAVDTDAFKSHGLGADFPLTLALASVSVSYNLDLFGRNRRELEGLRAAVDYERFELEAARLMLAGNVVAAAIEEASLKAEVETTETIVSLEAQQVGIAEQREQLGALSGREVVAQRTELAQTRATLPGLRARLERTRHRLSVYLGQVPGAAELPEVTLADLHLPSDLPLSVPSELVRQRPDIQAAEALLHRANAQLGVATANLYPQINLSGVGGALGVSSLLSGAAGFALLGASVAQPLFHGGELKAQKRSAVAALEEAQGAYRAVVLAGFQDVADVLWALDSDARTLRERAEATRLAKSLYDITSKQYEAGGVSFPTLLDAERQLLSASVEETRAGANRYADSAALFQALGGGWWTRNGAVEEGKTPSPQED